MKRIVSHRAGMGHLIESEWPVNLTDNKYIV